MTNNKNNENDDLTFKDTEYDLEWEESTKNRDKFKNKEQGLTEKAARAAITTMNLAIRAYNTAIALPAKVLSGKSINIEIKEINPDMSLEEIQASGAGTFGIGVVDSAVKFVRRVGLPALQGTSILGYGGPQLAAMLSIPLATLEGAIDHTKDLMLGNALGSLAAEVGDLKDGQSKLNSKINSQGKKMTENLNKLGEGMRGIKSELSAQGFQIGSLQSQTNRLDSSLNNLSQAHSALKAETKAQFEEVNERIDTTEVKITKNARDILEEKLEREAIDNELRDKIKENKLQLNNLHEQQEELREDFQSYQTKTDRKLNEVQQEIEDTQEEFTQQLKIQETKIKLEIEETQAEFERANNLINTKISQTQEILEEYEEEVQNIKHDQKRLNVEFQELTDDVETQFELIHQQTRKLDLVADQMQEITEETNRRMDKLENTIFDIEEQAEEAMNIARRATRQVNQLTEDLQKERKRIKNLEESVTKNRQETKQAKLEAQRANERLDNLIKTQQLADFTQEQLAFAKLEKTLQLKAEETKLLAQLNILNQTQKLLPEPEPAEREWKVGIQEGTVKEYPKPEGMPLVPGSRWEQEYSLEELREMGWDVRIKDKNKSAPLTTPDKRKPEKAPPKTAHKEQTAPKTNEEQQALKEQVESAKSQILEQIKEIQEQVNQNIAPLEENLAPEPESEDEEAPPAQLEEQEKELRNQRAQTKAQLTHQQVKQSQTKKEITQLKSAITKEQNKLKKTEKALVQEKNPPKKQELQSSQQESQQKLTELQQQLQEKQEQLTQQSQQTQQSSQEIQELTEQIEQIQTQSAQAQASQAEKEFQKETEQAQAEVTQLQQEILQQQWQQISSAQQQVIEEQAESQESPPEETSEQAQEQAEAEQELEQAEEEAAATQNQMTWMMLLLIIFLLEYIVYKRNGLPGLVVLNIALAIAYYNKDTILEYQHLWNDYILIIAYIAGNVLTYNAVQKEEHKWPAIAGYNTIIALIYAYTKWKQYQAQQKQESAQKKLTQTLIKKELTKNQIPEKELPVKFYNWEEKIQEKPLSQTTKFQQELTQAIQTKIEEKKEAEYIEQQAQIAQEQERIAQELKEQQKQIEQTLAETGKASVESSAINTEGLETRFPGFQTEFQRVKDWLYSILPANQKITSLTNLFKEINLSLEEKSILGKLYLTDDQILAVSLQSKKVKNYEQELRTKYPTLTTEQKLKLLNLGLQSLGFKTPKSKQSLVQVRQQLLQERQNFDLSYEEKESTLNFFITQLALTEEQQDELDNLGITLVNASNWKTTEKHRQALLKIGLQKIKLNPEEKQNISQPKPKLSSQNESLLKTLAPLAKEYKYSPTLLQSIKSLRLKYDTLSFFTQQQILPDTNLDFGQVKDPYKLLKQQIIEKEQKKIFKEQQAIEKEEISKKVQQIRESLLPSLIEFSQNHESEEFIELELPIYRERITYQDEKGITRGIESKEETWVNLKAIDLDHANLLFAQGFKAFKQYDYFELLLWAWGQVNPRIEFNEDWERWKNINPSFTKKLVWEWLKWGLSFEECKDWINIGLSVQDAKYCSWLKQQNLSPEWVLNEGNEDTLCEHFSEAENSLKPLNEKQLSWNQFLDDNPPLKTVWETYLLYQTEKLQAELEANQQELAEREAITAQKQNKQIKLEELIPSLAQYIDKKFEESGRRATSYQPEQTWTPTETAQTKPEPEQTSSRYDDLLSHLSQEEQERQQKKKTREEARRKLDDLEFNRREQNLDAKHQRIQAEEERRQRERELEEQELKARQQAFEARQQELKEQEEKRLTSQAEQIETKKKMAEEALAIKQKEAELAEQRKRAEIERIEKENEQEQQRLEIRAKLIEEEMQKRLAQIALEDQESRQRIQKECEERKAQLEREVLELKRKNERDLMLKEQELEKEKQEKDVQIEHLRKEADLAAKNFQEMQSKIAEEKEASEKLGETTSQAREQKLAAGAVHGRALKAVYEYYLDNDEIASCTNISHNTPSGSALPSVRSLFASHPEMRINLFNCKVMSGGEAGEKVSILTGAKFYYWNAKELTILINKCLGNGSYSKEGLEAKIKSISDGGFFD